MTNVNITHIIYKKKKKFHYNKHFLDLGGNQIARQKIYLYIHYNDIHLKSQHTIKNVFIDDIYLPLIWLKLLYYKHVLNLYSLPTRERRILLCFSRAQLNSPPAFLSQSVIECIAVHKYKPFLHLHSASYFPSPRPQQHLRVINYLHRVWILQALNPLQSLSHIAPGRRVWPGILRKSKQAWR